MLELTTNRCDEDERLFGGRQFATYVTDFLVISKRREVRTLQMVGNGVADESIYGEWSGANHNESCEASEIKQFDLVAHGPNFAPAAVKARSFIELKP
jgi:hypothetical protein